MDSQLLRRHVCEKITYIPSDPFNAYRELLDEVTSIRQCALAGLALRLSSALGDDPIVRGFVEDVREIAALPSATRRQLVDHPAFLVWLRQATQASAGQLREDQGYRKIANRIAEFPQLRSRVFDEAAGPCKLHVAESVFVRRDDLDPLLMAVAPPTYNFPDPGSPHVGTPESAYTLEFFCNVAEAALARIDRVWPSVYRRFPAVVHTLVHVPDAQLRSASASRYTGVVFLAAEDDNLLALEESLVHEFCHQILYRVMEVDPLVLNGPDTGFQLPWSGSERDYYGFFHAFYIYVVLAAYYGRVAAGRKDERDRALARQKEILQGLAAATPEILAAGRFTPLGGIFAEQMCRNALDLVALQTEGA